MSFQCKNQPQNLLVKPSGVYQNNLGSTEENSETLRKILLLDIDGVAVWLPGSFFDYTRYSASSRGERALSTLPILSGVLHGYAHALALSQRALFRQFNPELTMVEEKLIQNVQETRSEVFPDRKGVLQAGFKEYPHFDHFYLSIIARSTRMPEYRIAMLSELVKRGVKIGVMTDTPFLDRVYMLQMRYPNIFDPGLLIHPGNLKGLRKKDANYYSEAELMVKEGKNTCVYIEDMLGHLQRAARLGWNTIHARPGHGLEQIIRFVD